MLFSPLLANTAISANGSASAANRVMTGNATAVYQYTFPTAVAPNPTTVNVLAVGPDQSAHEKVQNSTVQASSSTWFDLGSKGIIPGVVAAVSRKANDIDVFARGFDGAMYRKNKNSSMKWTPAGMEWERIPGVLTTAPEVVSWEETRFDIFAIYSDAALWQRTWDTSIGWHNWSIIGGHWSFDAMPTVLSWSKGRVDVFMMHPDTNELYHRFIDPNATNWQPFYGFQNLGGHLAGRPSAVSWDVGRMDIFARGGDEGLWQLTYAGDNSSWTNWTWIGEKIRGEPSAVSLGKNRIDVFVWGDDYSYQWKSFNGTSWTPKEGFISLGGNFIGPPKAITVSSSRIEVFGYSNRGTVSRITWDDARKVWTPASFEDWGAPA